MFDNETPISAISVAEIPDSTEKVVVVPGLSLDDTDRLSYRQLLVYVPYVLEHYAPSTTWAEAGKKARDELLRGRQRAFGAIQQILLQSRKLTANETITDEQMNLLTRLISDLQGTTEHWDPAIRQKMNLASMQKIRQLLTEQALSVETRAQMQLFMNKFGAVFGRPRRADSSAILSADDNSDSVEEDLTEAF